MKKFRFFVYLLPLLCVFILSMKPQAATNGYYTYTVMNDEAIITDVNSSIKGAITIPEQLGGYPVTTIDQNAFEGCFQLTSVTSNDGLRYINANAFYRCESLSSVSLPNTIEVIGQGAFDGCKKLKFSEYGNGMYLGNTENPYLVLISATNQDITSFSIHQNTKLIATKAFWDCNKLTTATIGGNVQYIGPNAFSSCDGLTSVTIGGSVQKISAEAFTYCRGLLLITIEEGVQTIDAGAFAYCDTLASVSIPDSLRSLGDAVFAKCPALRYKTYSNAYYLGNTNNPYLILIRSTSKSITSCTIHQNTKFIYEGAFEECSKLKSVTLSKTLLEVGNRAFRASGLISVTFPCGVVKDRTFAECTALKNVTLLDGVHTIEAEAFTQCIFNEIKIPSSMKQIEMYAFCEINLTDVYYNGSRAQWDQFDVAVELQKYWMPAVTIHCAEDIAEPGDLNNIAGVDEYDAIYLLQHVLMPTYFQITQDADFDKNGVVSENDAIYLLQHVLMPDSFPLA